MRKLVFAAGWVVLVAGGAARAEDADPKAIVEKAIKAHGGADVLNKFPAVSLKTRGKYYGMGEGVDYTAEAHYQFPDRQRVEVQGTGFKYVQVVNGDKGWVVLGDETRAMDKEQLEEAREELYAGAVARLTPLTGAGYKLSPLGSIKVGDRDAVGVRVEHKGHRDVSLFFDKDNGLLLKTERRAKDLLGGGGEFTAAALYGAYKKVEGMQVAFKVTIQREGKRFVESETTEATPAEKLDASVFAKP
jgi:hypothetical protein